MKRIYFAAALIIASGAGIGFLMRPAAPHAETEQAAPDKNAKPEVEHARYSGGILRTMLPPPLNIAAANRADCFYMRVAYANSLNPGSKAGNPDAIRAAGANSGCWIPAQ